MKRKLTKVQKSELSAKMWQAVDDAINETLWEMPPGRIGTLRNKIINADTLLVLEEIKKEVSNMPQYEVAQNLFSYIQARERSIKSKNA
jgi:hypothetical protein